MSALYCPGRTPTCRSTPTGAMLLILLLTLGGLALLALIIILGIAAWVAHNMTLLKRVPVYGHPSQFGLVYEDVTFPSKNDNVPLRG